MKKEEFCKTCKQVGEGWSRLMLHMIGQLDGGSVELANSRRKICDECPSLGKSKTPYLQCKECKCFYPMLTYSTSKSCPLGKW